ncbi:MAG: hypothetical protein AAGA48_29045 [Myxococcota bacterium]
MRWLWLLVMGCSRFELVDACDPNNPTEGTCSPCGADSQCVFVGNPCRDQAICSSLDDEVVVLLAGCLGDDLPDDVTCQCIDDVCTVGER